MFKGTFLLVMFVFACSNVVKKEVPIKEVKEFAIEVGAQQMKIYLPMLQQKRVAVVANQTSVVLKNSGVGYVHLVDTLLCLDIDIVKIFSPEHGFRGKASAGEYVSDSKDIKTGLPVISLYGKNKKLPVHHLEGVDVVVFDIQDVGARFYTYLSTLHYVMEACAKSGIPLVVLDRPNPNGNYVDGPVLELQHQSFVGMHPVPVVYGMTIGEYAQMIQGEKWLAGGLKCNLIVVPLKNYNHKKPYDLPIKPSPNLPNSKSINLYPSLCFFEGTNISVGRGTSFQFQVIGSPSLEKEKFNFQFTPSPNEGSKYPKHEGVICYGVDLRAKKTLSKIELKWLIQMYQNSPNKNDFFNSFFTKLAGTEKLQKQIEANLIVEEISDSWQQDLIVFKKIRQQYLLYK